jgi:hypothetical protein
MSASAATSATSRGSTKEIAAVPAGANSIPVCATVPAYASRFVM